MSKSQPKRTIKKSTAARKRAAKKSTTRPRTARGIRPRVPIDRTPVVPETRATGSGEPEHIPAERAHLPEEVVLAIQAASSKQAQHLAVLDLRKAAGFTDFFVIATGGNPRQIRAIAEAVEEALSKRRVKPAHTEGYDSTEWILLDYFDFVVHVFSAETRRFYGLERLWGSANTIDISRMIGEPAPAPVG